MYNFNKTHLTQDKKVYYSILHNSYAFDSLLVKDFYHTLKIWHDTVALGSGADVPQHSCYIFSSSPSGDQEDGAAWDVEELLSLQSQQVREVLLSVVIHQNQAKALLRPFYPAPLTIHPN